MKPRSQAQLQSCNLSVRCNAADDLTFTLFISSVRLLIPRDIKLNSSSTFPEAHLQRYGKYGSSHPMCLETSVDYI